MPAQSGAIGYAIVMLLAGVGIPIMATMNGGLGARLHNPALATLALLVVASFVTLIYVAATSGLANPLPGQIPAYFYFGGVFVAFYVLSVTWIAPRFGVGNAISFVLLGQLISMALIDHFGLMGAIRNAITLQRLTGILLMTLGVFLAVKRGGTQS